jgi:threonine dehydrogenase-like Zn-dependent dehydrogenase
MKAAVFVKSGKIALQEKPIPNVGPADALIKVTTTTICGTGQRIIVGAITLCGQCYSCLDHHQAQCGGKDGVIKVAIIP